MSDLVERIAEWRARAVGIGTAHALLGEAAKEIARLRAERDEVRARLDRADCTHREGGDTRHCRHDRLCWHCRHDEAVAEIERLRTDRDEWMASAAGYGTDVAHLNLDRLTVMARALTAERERDELRALLREATAPSECAVCHAALLPTLEIPHCEDCIVTDDAAIDYEEASRDFVARLDAVLGGAK